MPYVDREAQLACTSADTAACDGCNKRKHAKAHPSSWSADFDACVSCGTTARRFVARGMCNSCYQRAKNAASLRPSDWARIEEAIR